MTHFRPALFLDRDGVVNEEVDYLWQPENCRLVDGIIPLIRAAKRLGYFVTVVTNQAGIGRGLYTEADFHRLMDHIQGELRPHGAELDAIYFSPFHPVHGTGEYARDSDCRKPGPGMLLRAAAEHDLDLPASVLVGDRYSDMAAAEAAGVPYRFLFGNTETSACGEGLSCIRVQTLHDVTLWLQVQDSNFRRSRKLTPEHAVQPAELAP